MNYCECGCGQIAGDGNRFIYQHHRKGKSPSLESNLKRSMTQKGREWSDSHKKHRKPHKSNCQCFWCKNKRGELKGEHCPNHGRRHTEDEKKQVSKTLKARKGHKPDCLCPFCKAKKGQHPNWRGGISQKGYPSKFNEKLKALIRERDGHSCQLCSKSQKQNKRSLDVHHIDYDKENLDPKNRISLCQTCNTKVNFRRSYWADFFGKKLKIKESLGA